MHLTCTSVTNLSAVAIENILIEGGLASYFAVCCTASLPVTVSSPGSFDATVTTNVLRQSTTSSPKSGKTKRNSHLDCTA